MHLVIALIAVAFLGACDRPTAPTPPMSPPSASGPRVVFPDGFGVHVEIAADDATREQGLMYRDQLAPDYGMIFIFPTSGVYPFWMKNTLIPLDMIWIDDSRHVAHIEANVQPCKADPCPSYPPGASARYVLEVAAGVAAQHHLANSSLLSFEGLDHVVVR